MGGPTYGFEEALGGIVCGVDEAGRGPFAGPVVAAAAIILSLARLPQGIDDSKRLSAARRVALLDGFSGCVVYAVGTASVAEIDRINILHATMLAMRRAVARLPLKPDAALIDGNRAPDVPCAAHVLVRGDGRSLSIAAASIVAKVTRDRLMARLAVRYPGYGWERNAGYGTREHRRALMRLGPTPHHRFSFAPVAAVARAIRD